MTGRLLGGVCLLLTFAACAQPTDEVIIGEPGLSEPAADIVDDNPTATGIMFASDLASAQANTFQAKFVIPDQIDILAWVPVPADPAIQFLKFDIYGPDGMPYETKWRAFTTDDSAPDSVDHPTIDGTVPVRQVIEGSGPPHVLLAIPIAGTNITRYSLIGVFRTEVQIGVEDAPPAAHGDFEIMQPDGMGM